MLIWGLSWSNGKIIASYLPAQLLMFWRFMIATLSLLPIILIKKMDLCIPKKAIPPVIVCSSMLTLYNYFFFAGTKVGLAGAGGVLVTTTNPIFTYILTLIIFRKIPAFFKIIGLFLGLLGGCILLKIWSLNWQQLVNGGNFMFLMCSFTWAFITLVSPKALEHVNIFVYSFWTFFLSTLFSIPFVYNMNLLLVFKLDWIFWINLLAVSIGALSIATSIYFNATSKLGPDKAASFIFVVPIGAMGFSMIIFNEALKWNTCVGGILAIFAVYLINRK